MGFYVTQSSAYVQPPSTLAGKLAVQLKPLFGDSCCNYKPSGFPTEAVSVTDFKGQKSGHVWLSVCPSGGVRAL